MYTQCPKCATVFRITATQLRIAEGEVRCGNCTVSFNALAALTDDLPELTDAVIPENDDDSVAQLDTDVGIESTPPDEPAQPSNDTENADPAEGTLEFDAPEVSWSRFFVSSASDEDEEGSVDADSSDRSGPSVDDSSVDDSSLERETRDPDEWKGFLSDLDDGEDPRDDNVAHIEDDGAGDEWIENADPGEDEAGIVIAPDPDDDWDREDGHARPWSLPDDAEPSEPPLVFADTLSDDDANDAIADEPDFVTGAAYEPIVESGVDEYLEHRAGELPALFAEEPEDQDDVTHDEISIPWRSVMIIVLLTVAFFGQLLHYNRDRLATHPEYGAEVRKLYASLDSPLYPDWQLDAFRVRGTEAVAGRSGASALDILATIEVVSAEPVGLPLVRVALHDRWATPVASRIFHPSEYLRGDTEIPDILPNGTTLPVEVSVVDPGTEAQSYVIDICIPHRSNGLQCQLSQDPFQS